MGNSKKPRVWFVYGNHGDTPVQIEDYVQYLGLYLSGRGWNFCLTKEPVPGELNILLECFNEVWANRIISLKQEHPLTKIVLLMSENVGGGTFNQFRGAIKKAAENSSAGEKTPVALEDCLPAGSSLPKFTREWFSTTFFKLFRATRLDRFAYAVLKRLPMLFGPLQKFYRSYIKSLPPAILPYEVYDDVRYWVIRYENFLRVSDIADHLACVSPDLRDGYVELFGEDQVHQLSFGAVAARPLVKQRPEEEKDIDVFFSGTRTPHRTKILEKLSGLGLRVVVAPPTTPAVIRENLLARSKLCLHLRQDEFWRTPSIMRVHQIVSSGNILLAEQTPVTSKFTELTIPFEADSVESVVLRELRAGRFKERGEELLARYNRELSADDEFHFYLVRLMKETRIESVNALVPAPRLPYAELSAP